MLVNITNAVSLNYLSSLPDSSIDNVVFLSYFNGSNGSTSIVDEKLHNVSSFNGASLTTSDFKFGSASLNLDGIDDYIRITANSNDEFKFLHDGSNFTLEAFIKCNLSANTEHVIFDNTGYRSSNTGLVLSINNNGSIRLFITRSSNTNPTIDLLTSTGLITNNTWQHIAVVCSDSTLTIYVDGVNVGSQVGFSFGTQNPSHPDLLIGAWNNNFNDLFFSGKIDNVRITKDIARYTSNFTPPTSTFPNF
ncbi:LamG domain-containing protein [Calothrix sp. FACHB-1219]|uniref:LamG domain-containing protein n=1 Tax=unclassified Calothrix TaxID=2619626 RepID=UPI001688E323|nr:MULTISPECIES: LamG domain-containing protein [unclassified Calothrix]MBD2201803.1 LamG domain-containing protein [Calothrix sp. FACHB-168]MBD2217489.1 LamG domain-containing protein [Calothrix sp. FACHB-1219]